MADGDRFVASSSYNAGVVRYEELSRQSGHVLAVTRDPHFIALAQHRSRLVDARIESIEVVAVSLHAPTPSVQRQDVST